MKSQLQWSLKTCFSIVEWCKWSSWKKLMVVFSMPSVIWERHSTDTLVTYFPKSITKNWSALLSCYFKITLWYGYSVYKVLIKSQTQINSWRIYKVLYFSFFFTFSMLNAIKYYQYSEDTAFKKVVYVKLKNKFIDQDNSQCHVKFICCKYDCFKILLSLTLYGTP